MNQARYKRRNYFIKKELQGKYIFSYFLFVMLGSVVFTLILSILSSGTISLLYENSHFMVGQTPVILFRKIFSANWLLISLGGIIVVGGSMLITHRIAGPLFRFEKSMDDMINGKIGFMIHLRTKDECQELADKFNRFNQELAASINAIRLLSMEIAAILEKQNPADGIPAPPAAADDLQRLQGLNKQICEILHSYTLKDSFTG